MFKSICCWPPFLFPRIIRWQMRSDFNDVDHLDVWHTSRHALRSSLLQIMAEFLHSSFGAPAVVTVWRGRVVIQSYTTLFVGLYWYFLFVSRCGKVRRHTGKWGSTWSAAKTCHASKPAVRNSFCLVPPSFHSFPDHFLSFPCPSLSFFFAVPVWLCSVLVLLCLCLCLSVSSFFLFVLPCLCLSLSTSPSLSLSAPRSLCLCLRLCVSLSRSLSLSLCFSPSVCLSACLPVCLSACLPVCLSACLPVFLSSCLPVCLSACLPVCLPVFLSSCPSVYLPACLAGWLAAWLAGCLPARCAFLLLCSLCAPSLLRSGLSCCPCSFCNPSSVFWLFFSGDLHPFYTVLLLH